MANPFVLTTQLAVHDKIIGLDKAIRTIRTSLNKVDAPIGVKVTPGSISAFKKDLGRKLSGYNVPITVKITPGAIGNVKNLTLALVRLKNIASTLRSTTIFLRVTGSTASKLNTLSKAFLSITQNARDAATAVRSFNAAINAGLAGINAYARSMKTATGSNASLGRVLKTTSDFAEHFADITALATRRFIAYQLGARTLLAVFGKLGEAFRAAIQFQGDLITLGQVTGQTALQLSKLGDTIRNTSIEFGVSSSELVGVAKTLSQAEFAANDLEAAMRAIAKARLGPSFGDIDRITDGLIAARAQFKLTSSQFESSLGAINAVSKAFAVESDDLITVIQKAGGAFASAGGTLNELLATFTSIRATTRESADSIATALRTLVPRFQRQSTIGALREIGVELVDAEGKFVGMFEAANRLNKALAELPAGDIRFAQTAEILGGVRQFSKIIPLITEADKRQRALNIANAAGNSLNEDAARAQEKITVQLTKLNEQFNKLISDVIGTKTFQLIFDGFIFGAKAVLKFADALKELLPIATAFATVQLGRFAITAAKRFPTAFTRLNTGGKVPGQGDEDTVNALLTPGEFVIRKGAVKAIGKKRLEALNSLNPGDLPRFASGGYVGGFARGGLIPDGSNLLGTLVQVIKKLEETLTGTDNSLTRLIAAFKKEESDRSRDLRRLGVGNIQKNDPTAQNLAVFASQRPAQATSLLRAQRLQEQKAAAVVKSGVLRNIEASAAARDPAPFVPGLRTVERSSRGKTARDTAIDRDADRELNRREVFAGPSNPELRHRGFADAQRSHEIIAERRNQALALDSDGRLAARERRLREQRQRNSQIQASTKARINAGQSSLIARLSAFSQFGRQTSGRLSDELAASFIGPQKFSSNLSDRPDIVNIGSNGQPITSDFRSGFGDSTTTKLERRDLPRQFKTRVDAQGRRRRVGGGFVAGLKNKASSLRSGIRGSLPIASAAFDKIGGTGTAGIGLLLASQAVSNVGAKGALAGAGTGAVVGSALGPFGTVVGAAVGGLTGFISATKEAAKALEDADFARKLESIGTTIEGLSSGKSGASVGTLVSQFSTIDERRRSVTTNGDDRVALEQSVSQITGKMQDFSNQLAGGSKTIDEFTNKGGLKLLTLISRETGESFESLKAATEKTIDFKQKELANDALLQQAATQRLREFQSQQGLLGSLQDAAAAADVVSTSFTNMSNIVNGNLGVSEFSLRPGAGSLSRIDNTTNIPQLKAGVDQVVGLLGEQFSGLGQEAVSSASLSRELPSILKSFGAARSVGKDFDIFGALKNSLGGKLPQSIISSISAAIGGMDEQDLLRELDDVQGLSAKLIEDAGLGSSAELLGQAADVFTDQLNKFTSQINVVLENEIRTREGRISRLDGILSLEDDLFKQSGGTETLASARVRQDILAKGSLGQFDTGNTNPSDILRRIIDTRNNIQGLEGARNNATDSQSIAEFTKRIAESNDELDALNRAFSIMSDQTKQINILQSDLDQTRGSRLGRRDALTDFAFSDTAGRADLNKQALATRLALDGGLNAVPSINRPDVGQFLGRFANTEVAAFGLSDRLDANGLRRNKTGAEAAADLAAEEIGQQAALLGIDPEQVRQTFIDGFTPIETKIANSIVEAFEKQNKLADALDSVNKDFLGGFNGSLVAFDTSLDTFLSEFISNLDALEKSRLSAERVGTEGKLERLAPNIEAARRVAGFGTGNTATDARVLDLVRRSQTAQAPELKRVLNNKDVTAAFAASSPLLKGNFTPETKVVANDLIDKFADANNFARDDKRITQLRDRAFSELEASANVAGFIDDESATRAFQNAVDKTFSGNRQERVNINQELQSEGAAGKALFERLVGADESTLKGFGEDLASLGTKTLPELETEFNTLSRTLQGLNGILATPPRTVPATPLQIPPQAGGPVSNGLAVKGQGTIPVVSGATVRQQGGAALLGTTATPESQEASNALTVALAAFSGNSAALATAMNNFPRTLEINAKHEVQVVVLGGEVFTRIEPSIRALVVESIESSLDKMLKDRFPGAKSFA